MGYRSSKNKTDYILKKINENYITESRTIRNLMGMNSEEVKISIENLIKSQDKNFETIIRKIVNMQNDIKSISHDVKAIKDKEQKHYDETIKRLKKIELITIEKSDDANSIIKNLSKTVIALLIVITVLTICVNFGI